MWPVRLISSRIARGSVARPGLISAPRGRASSIASLLLLAGLLGMVLVPVLTAQESQAGAVSSVSCDVNRLKALPVRFASATPSRDEQAVARAWCATLYVTDTRSPLDSSIHVRWLDPHKVGVETAEDLAWVWALRTLYLQYRRGRLEVEVVRSPQPAHDFSIVTTYNTLTEDSSYTVAASTISYASVSGDTVLLTSALTESIGRATQSFETSHIHFIALGGATIDTAAALKADSFVSAVRRRTMRQEGTAAKPRYFVTPDDVAAANATLGIRFPPDTMGGFVWRGSASEAGFLWGGSIGAGALYYHELVHLARVTRTTELPEDVEEAVAVAFGGTRRSSFNQWVCTSLGTMLARTKSSRVSQLILRPPAFDDIPRDFHDPAALILRFVDESSDEPRVARVLEALPKQVSFVHLVLAAAHQLGITGNELLNALDEEYGPEGLRRRCEGSSSLTSR